MPHPIAYLGFQGTCEQAMRCYERAAGGRLDVLMGNGQSPLTASCSPASPNRILHAHLILPGGGTLMAVDCPAGMP